MNTNFKPLLPALPATAAVASPALSSLQPTIAPVLPVVPKTHGHAAPTVSFKRDGDKITHITVTCRCGEVIEMTCAY